MSDRKNGPPTGRDESGRFVAGNSGRPAGSRNRATLAVEALLAGEAEGLARMVIRLALLGDTTALRLALERIAPARKDNPVAFDLPPLKSVADAAVAAGAVLEAVSAGDLTPSEATACMGLIDSYRRVLETTDLELRLSALEAANGRP